MSDALLVRSFQNLPDLNVWRKSSLSIFAFKLTCWLANGQTAWWTSIKTQWRRAIRFGNRGMKWSGFCATAAQRTGPSVQRSQPCRVGSKGISKPTTWWGIQLVWNGLKSRNQNVKRKKNVPYFIAGPHRWRFLVRSTHINIGQKCQGRISAWQSSLVELRPVNIYNINIKYLFTSHAPRIAKNDQNHIKSTNSIENWEGRGERWRPPQTQPRNHANDINSHDHLNLGCVNLHPQLLWHPNNFYIATQRLKGVGWIPYSFRFLVENISVAKGFKGVAVSFCRTCSGNSWVRAESAPLYPPNRNKIAMATVTKTWLVIETGKLLHQCIYIFFQSNIHINHYQCSIFICSLYSPCIHKQ